jgi:hypothetical protein
MSFGLAYGIVIVVAAPEFHCGGQTIVGGTEDADAAAGGSGGVYGGSGGRPGEPGGDTGPSGLGGSPPSDGEHDAALDAPPLDAAPTLLDVALPPLDAHARDAAPTLPDVALPPLDAALATLDAAPAGQAGFAFIVNDVVRRPMTCLSENWEFAPYPSESVGTCMPRCFGVESVLIVNTSAHPMPYVATSAWNIVGGYVPGVQPGGCTPTCLAGVLEPGAILDITSVYSEGIVAVLGSPDPFSMPDSGEYVSDEGWINWPAQVSGSGGSTVMWVAEIEVPTAPPATCQIASKIW